MVKPVNVSHEVVVSLQDFIKELQPMTDNERKKRKWLTPNHFRALQWEENFRGRTKEAGDSASARIRSVSPGQDSKSKSRKRSTRGSKSLSPSRASRRPSLIGTSIAFSPTLSSSQKAEINSELPPEQHLQNMETLFDAALNEVLLAMYTDSFTRFECA